ncbi:MAG: magnesium transporter [Pirellulales bacterium]|nr:magnesium transporter [Pirellulales bacterium]
MANTLYLPELREMLAENNAAELREFCTALHPARTAEFMEGLTAEESWAVLQHADMPLRVEIFGYFEDERKIEIVEKAPREEIVPLVAEMPADDRVDLLADVELEVVQELMPLLPAEERRDIQRLSRYAESTAGALMTSDFARLSENWAVSRAIDEIRVQAEDLETIYYLYVVDDEDHLRGLISFRQLLSAMGKPETKIGDLMERDLVTVNAQDDREEVARKVADYDLLAIPVVDDEYRLVGIITHDDVIDVMREEAEEDAYRMAGVAPLDEGYLKTHLLLLTWKRGIWLTILFFGAMLTAVTLNRYMNQYQDYLNSLKWVMLFIPLVISTGGNSGNQSATLIITALSTGSITLKDWWRVVWREVLMGVLLGGALGMVGFGCGAILIHPFSFYAAATIPITLMLVVVCGTLTGSLLPLLFHRLGLDPALMSNAFVAGLIDVVGINIYMWIIVAMDIHPG